MEYCAHLYPAKPIVRVAQRRMKLKQNPVITYLLNTLLTIAFCMLFCLSEGLIGALSGIIICALLAIVYNHHHYGLGLANSALIIVIMVLNLGALPGLAASVPFVLVALSLAMSNVYKLSIYKLLMVCALLFTASAITNMMLVSHLTGGEVTLSSMILDAGRTMRETFAAELADPSVAGTIEQVIKLTVDMCIKLSPSVFIIVSLVESFVLIMIYKKLEERRQTPMDHLLPFEKWQGDKGFAITFLVMLGLFITAPAGMFSNVLFNVVVVLGFLFAVLGLSVFAGRNQRRTQAKNNIVLAVLCLLAAFVSVVGVIVLVSGVLDCFLDFRKLRKEN